MKPYEAVWRMAHSKITLHPLIAYSIDSGREELREKLREEVREAVREEVREAVREELELRVCTRICSGYQEL